MSKKPLVSIIVRTKNEERWIDMCLNSIKNQTYSNHEVIVVDNNSTDRTVERAERHNIKLVNIDKFIPGKAINDGIKASTGDYLVCISAHCIPVNNVWLENLVKALEEDEKLAGVYGRQEPLSFTPATDKRDLALVFGLDKKVQYKDPFFHNANSIFRRSVWEKIPFCENATNIEDRIWGRDVLNEGYIMAYEPSASVYHYHGIHQSQNKKRCENVVRIIESLNEKDGFRSQSLDPKKLKINAIVPVKGIPPRGSQKCLLDVTIKQLKECSLVDRIFVSTDNLETAEIAKKMGAEVPFIRAEELSYDHVDLEHVYQYTLQELENRGIFSDLIVTCEITFPFRPKSFFEKLVNEIVEKGVDSVIAVKPEYGICYSKEDGDLKLVGQGFVPRKYKDPMYVGVKGMGCVSQPVFIREANILGNNTGVIEVEDQLAMVEVRENNIKVLDSVEYNL